MLTFFLIGIFIGLIINQHVKGFIKKIVHWFIDHRKIRLERGQSIFRYYWYLWILSPFILFGLWIFILVTIGVRQGLGS